MHAHKCSRTYTYIHTIHTQKHTNTHTAHTRTHIFSITYANTQKSTYTVTNTHTDTPTETQTQSYAEKYIRRLHKRTHTCRRWTYELVGRASSGLLVNRVQQIPRTATRNCAPRRPTTNQQNVVSTVATSLGLISIFLCYPPLPPHASVCATRPGGAHPAFSCIYVERASIVAIARLRGACLVSRGSCQCHSCVQCLELPVISQPWHTPHAHMDPPPAPLFIGIHPLVLAKRRICEIDAWRPRGQCKTQHCQILCVPSNVCTCALV